MVLGTWVPGRVGRCRINNAKGGTEKSRPVRVLSTMRYGCPMGKPKGNREKVNLLAIGAEIEDLHLTQLAVKKHLTLQMFQKTGAVLARHGAGKLKEKN